MSTINDFFSGDFTQTVLTISFRYSLVLLVTLASLFLAGKFSSRLRALLAFLGLTSIVAITALQLLVPPLELNVLPAEIPQSQQSAVVPQIANESLKTTESAASSVAETNGVARTSRDYLSAIWICGALSLLAYWIVGQFRLFILLKQAKQTLGDHPLRQSLDALLARSGLHIKLRIYVSASTELPFTCGFFRKLIVLPESSLDWSERQLEMIFLHELAHHKHHDLIAQLWIKIALALQWFNPLAWVALRAYVSERERACDDFVLHSGQSPAAYGACLIGFVKNSRCLSDLNQVGLAMAATGTIEKRLCSILDSTRQRAAPSRLAQSVALFLASTTIFSVGLLRLEAKSLAFSESKISSTLDKSKTQIQIAMQFVEVPRELYSDQILTQIVNPREPFNRINAETHQSLISLILKDSDVDLLTAPKIWVLANKTANVTVGQELRFPRHILDDTTVRFDDFDMRLIGVTVEMTPSLKGTDAILLDTKARVTDFMGFVELNKTLLKSGFTFNASFSGSVARPVDLISVPVLEVMGRDLNRVEMRSGETLALWLNELQEDTFEQMAAPILDAFDQKKINLPNDTNQPRYILALVTPRIIPMAVEEGTTEKPANLE